MYSLLDLAGGHSITSLVVAYRVLQTTNVLLHYQWRLHGLHEGSQGGAQQFGEVTEYRCHRVSQGITSPRIGIPHHF